ncbi:hypothetical protein AAFF_G00063090 [Aldrovandia affinis]|uniref:Disrupted in schizophrenia 1 protein n=1 Tax=Aldrovandia affinis TaxID=143900 RepID=A0AAD7WDP4_9TELE|nr:hypothetical protein AAFF_G00063090 [Aldrovandia affinis]
MFAGMVRLESQARSTSNIDSNSIHLPLHTGMREGGPDVFPAAVPVDSGSRRNQGRRPGYMRAEGEGRRPHVTPASCAERVSHGDPLAPGLACDPTFPPAVTQSQGGQRPSSQGGERLQHRHRPPSAFNQGHRDPAPLDRPYSDSVLRCERPSPAHRADSLGSAARDQFTSSFSFIRLSLSSDQETDSTSGRSSPCSPSQSGSFPHPQPGPALPDESAVVVTDKPLDPSGPQWGNREGEGEPAVTPELKDLLPDSDSCSLSLDSSDSASASSLTSGYESATPCGGDGWDSVLKRYEGILQDCLHSNRTNAQIEAMMLKLQRLQQKAILEDDYDTAERFGQKLEELQREKSSLKLGLPSRHHVVSHFLERLRTGVHRALQEAVGSDIGERRELVREEAGWRLPQDEEHTQDPRTQRDRLLQEKQLVQEETQELCCRLRALQERSQQLEQELLQEEQLEQPEEREGPALRSCTLTQLQDLGRVLDDLVTSEHRTKICTHPPPLICRLKEQEAALDTCIKETTAKVVMSQRLGGSLRRKVSASETQLLALHEAKLSAISGSDFSSAKELRTEMKALCGERDRLDGLVKRLQALSLGNSQELARMKGEHSLLRRDLEHEQAQFEKTQRENAVKYIELLEDRLHSCGNSAVERVWEADLEACHLLLRGLQHRAPSCSGPDSKEALDALEPRPQPRPKQEQDCAMLTALGGRWCPEADLQHSEFTKKLEEFLFCMEDNQLEDPCDEAAEVTEVTEQCKLIHHRLESLEEQLQSLQEQVQEVKATLQAMLKHLQEAQGEVQEQDEEDEDNMDEGGDEEDEDHYFSDSWTI